MISGEEAGLVCLTVEEIEKWLSFKGASPIILILLVDLERDLCFRSTDLDLCFNMTDPEGDREWFSVLDCDGLLVVEGEVDLDPFLAAEVDLALCLLAFELDRDRCLFRTEPELNL